jgi:hypothetical protein
MRTTKLTVYGSYGISSRDRLGTVHTQVIIHTTVNDSKMAQWLQAGPPFSIFGEIILATPKIEGAGRWRFFAWELGDCHPSFWLARVERLIEEGKFFGFSAETTRKELAYFPLLPYGGGAVAAESSRAPTYLLAQCWYAKEVDEEAKRKAFSEETMKAVRDAQPGQWVNK